MVSILKKELPTELVSCSADICVQLNNIYQNADMDNKLFLSNLAELIRKNFKMPAEDLASQLNIGRSTLFYRLQTLGIKFNDLKEALKLEAEEKFKRKLERREVLRLPPKDYAEFLKRDIVQKVIKAMSLQTSKAHMNRVLRKWYDLCRTFGISPEDLTTRPPEEIQKYVMDYISDRAMEGRDINWLISVFQTLQKWLQIPLLPPGVTQKEYKGKYQQAQIPFEVRNLVVKDLIDKYKETKNTIYIRAIQAMALLYYTGSRRQALLNYQKSDVIEVGDPDMIEAFGESKFRIIATLEKRGLRWNKLIPYSYDKIIPAVPFMPSELSKIGRIIYEELLKYFDKYNEDTRRYLRLKKYYHVWRHTATREWLAGLRYNRYLVAKILGWIKDSNLVIYGDFDLLALLKVRAEKHKIKFVSDELYHELLRIVERM